MVAADSVLTLEAQGQTGGWIPTDDTALRAGVLNRLTPFFDVLGATITRGSTVANILDFQWFHWQYKAIVTIKTRIGYASPDDVRSIVGSAFYQAGGAMPSITIRSLGETQGPGIEQEGPSLGGLFTGTTAVIVLGLVGLVYVIAYAPNVRDVARAVR
jgi:hypothetical protein